MPRHVDANGNPRLTLKQNKFIDYYIGEANGNATEAARLAGYAVPPQQGSENLSKPVIRAAIDRKLAELTMPAAEVIARLTEHARADVADFEDLVKFALNEDGDPTIDVDLKGAKRKGKSRLIKKIVPTKYGITIELHDSQAALEKLGRYYGLFKAPPIDTSNQPGLDDPAAAERALKAADEGETE